MPILHVFEKVHIADRIFDCKIDTGAFTSSMDSVLADTLGLVTVESNTIIRTSLGTEKRRVVETPITLGGHTFLCLFNVADRSKFLFPILIGRRSLFGFTIQVNEDETDPLNYYNIK